ncbi:MULTISPECIES: double-strand break repair helicase AddA [Sphingomonas]|jgi:ATP-dependent helicase/nuclease subunit A|uniref:DNA 3'-5' helicase n=1 Tax=Sphingomonas hankookensis TaxID=563996 RepID=A0ABR5YF48_9SPHN|nr:MULTISPECIES: double-strand break repair helicase AddA [Sphingomonas]KZE16249.1 DNA helicase UvrD [Sphingomonas hankookensis]PZT92765.1 MAG: double-strand break repair helicase AddA [Sphingomonas sp.]RSV31877.1 double-strand break repair helicase AddA [Sphingomonas sp. ABOLH]
MAVSEVRALQRLKNDQAAASDPHRHVWLSASAGTGKTHVLSARVFRLLLRGVDPAAILCLTFTKAGAAEMAERVASRLARWVRLPTAELKADLFALGEDVNDPALLARARTLFARVLDAPGGGVRIQTIHGFCQSLLAGFPVEAGLVPGFRPLEAREEAGMAREALAELLVEEQRTGSSRIGDAIAAMSLRMGEGAAENFLRECAKRPQAMTELPSGIQPFLRRALDLPSMPIDEMLAEACSDDEFDCDALERLAAANLAWGTATGKKTHGAIMDWLAASPVERAARVRDIRKIFFTAEDTLRKASAKLVAAEPDYDELAYAVGGRAGELIEEAARMGYADALADALEAGRAYADAYVRAKRRAGAVDFDDLIRETLNLLAQPGIGDWVRFKLDQTTEHVLIDEAQDTNPQQWAIVRSLVEEFFSGDAVRTAGMRTLFVVGDYKQAIFGFQGTDPIYFRAAHVDFERRAALPDDYRGDARELDTLSLTHSFRTTRPVLEFVDAAIAALPDPGMGIDAPDTHDSEVPGPGTVTLWAPTVVETPDDAEEGWIDDVTRVIATKIAREIAGWIGTLPLESKGRMLQPGDIMVLVKRRGDLASLIVARLYAEGVPVAGVDRLRLDAPLAVKDLLAAIRFALQPDDDLSLACLLVSPLIGWTQEQLLAGALRESGSLWRHLRRTNSEVVEPLSRILRRADFATPYRFLEELLSGEMDGRRKLIARLGEEARDPIDELLNAALSFESVATSSLQRFVEWFDRGEVEIKRDAGGSGGAVRVMTAHGSKGLQAPLVLLADAAIDPENSRRGVVQWAPESHDGAAFPLFRPRGSEAGTPVDGAFAASDRRELEEHWRLFYVAATRAEERLVIAGAPSPKCKGIPPALSWYSAAAAAFDALGVPGSEDGDRLFTGLTPQPPIAVRARSATAPAAAASAPAWLRAPAPAEARPPRPLAPSAVGEDEVSDPPPTATMRAAAERGRLLHQLFERLPELPRHERANAAGRWLAGAAGVEDAALRRRVTRDAMAVLDDPAFADLFGPDALAEAPIAAVVGTQVVAGTVDRLCVGSDTVRVVDFKTGRRVPDTVEDIPVYHLRQMAAYAAALRVIFPDHAVEAALLYTAGPRLFVLPGELLDAHKPGLGAGEQSLPRTA